METNTNSPEKVYSYSAKFSICKGKMGGFQASPIPPTWNDGKTSEGKPTRKVTKEGAILIELAPFLKEEDGNKYYDWANKKVSFGLGLPDIASIIGSGGAETKLVHVNEKTSETKTLIITPGKGDYEGTFMMSLNVSREGGEKTSSRIAFSSGEWAVFLVLLRSQVPALLGW